MSTRAFLVQPNHVERLATECLSISTYSRAFDWVLLGRTAGARKYLPGIGSLSILIQGILSDYLRDSQRGSLISSKYRSRLLSILIYRFLVEYLRDSRRGSLIPSKHRCWLLSILVQGLLVEHPRTGWRDCRSLYYSRSIKGHHVCLYLSQLVFHIRVPMSFGRTVLMSHVSSPIMLSSIIVFVFLHHSSGGRQARHERSGDGRLPSSSKWWPNKYLFIKFR